MTDNKMTNILMAGVGGQGTLLASEILSEVLMQAGYDVKKAEVHGMAQRGGNVESHVRFSDTTIASTLIPHGQADLIIGVEPVEALRHEEFLKPDGCMVSSVTPVMNFDAYPDLQGLLHRIAQINEIDTFDHAPFFDVEAGNDSFG